MAGRAFSEDTYALARASMVRKDFFGTAKYYEQKTRADRSSVDPGILLFERRFLAKMKSIGIPMFAHCVVRSVEEQDKLFAGGFSRARGGDSPHQYGLAIDLIHSTMGWDLPHDPAKPVTTNKCWEMIGVIGKEVAATAEIPIEWGGDWDFWDPAHWQIADWRRLAGLQ